VVDSTKKGGGHEAYSTGTLGRRSVSSLTDARGRYVCFASVARSREMPVRTTIVRTTILVDLPGRPPYNGGDGEDMADVRPAVQETRRRLAEDLSSKGAEHGDRL